MNEQTAKQLIDNTRDDYNLIADQFASTRHFNWTDTTKPIKELGLGKNDKILDLGCGNARLYELLKDYDIQYFGSDISDRLVNIAKKNVPHGNFEVCNLLDTSYKNNFFDSVISIAVLHHIPRVELRKKAFDEMYRITKPGGKILITVWYFWETKKYLSMIDTATKFDLPYGDFYMPWKTGSGKEITKRYFHAWCIPELHEFLEESGFTNIEVKQSLKSSGLPGYNLVAIAQKPK